MNTTEPLAAPASDRLPKLYRHALRIRRLDVLRVEQISRSCVRVTLGGPELEGFISMGFDDHIKVFFAPPGKKEPVLPSVGPNGLEMPKDPHEIIARSYTPRRYDPTIGELDIDFTLHNGNGLASSWVRSVVPGDSAWIAGPRSSLVFPVDFDGHLLIADQTGLSALARRLEELPSRSRAVAMIEVDDKEDQISINTASDAQIHWVHRRGAPAGETPVLLNALSNIVLPPGEVFAWIACESRTAKQLHSILITERGINPKLIRATGYW